MIIAPLLQLLEILKENKHPFGLHKFFFVQVISLAYEKQLTIKQELDIEGYTIKLLKLYKEGVFKTLNENPDKKVIVDQNGNLTWYQDTRCTIEKGDY